MTRRVARLLALVVGGLLGWALVVACTVEGLAPTERTTLGASYATTGLTVSWRATCGSISPVGAYTAPSMAPSGGRCLVIATRTDNGHADTATATIAAATVTHGRPFGPFALWSSATTVAWGPTPFTVSIGASTPSTVCTQIATARAMIQRLVLFMTGGDHVQYMTDGAFDLAKWKAKMDSFNTAAIRACVAQAVADGTVVGNSMMDEPESGGPDGNANNWGGNVTKPMLDQMAAYGHGIFPTLPMGVNHGADGWRWRPTEHYRRVDYVINQYAGRVGSVTTWLANVTNQFKSDSVALAWSINILGGGAQDRDGNWTCDGPGQAGLGPYPPTCRTPADSLRVWGRTLGPRGCLLVMWTFNDEYMRRADNQAAFRDIATTMAQQPATRCGRT